MSPVLLKTLFLVLTVSMTLPVFAQPAERKISRNDYINTWKDEAVRQMIEHGVPASITLAQGILESADGNSALAQYANNHFGIKCHGWDGPGFYADDDKPDECFRKYTSAEESFKDHSLFLAGRDRYSALFDLKLQDYKGWAKGLKKAGYATNPKYPDLLINIIEKYRLYEYDKMKKMPKHQPETEQEDVYLLAGVNHKMSLSENNIKSVVVKKGDSYYKIAQEFDMGLWQLFKYNDLKKDDVLYPGDILYLQPKRRKSTVSEFHTTKKGDTMHSISQRYGIKLERLYQLNNMRVGAEPFKGQQLSLQKKLK